MIRLENGDWSGLVIDGQDVTELELGDGIELDESGATPVLNFGAGRIDRLVKIERDGEATVYSADARGRQFWIAVNRDVDPATIETIQWGGAGINPLSYRFGASYAGADVGLDGGATGEGTVQVYIEGGSGRIYVEATGGLGGGGAWNTPAYCHVRIDLGVQKLAATPDVTIS